MLIFGVFLSNSTTDLNSTWPLRRFDYGMMSSIKIWYVVLSHSPTFVCQLEATAAGMMQNFRCERRSATRELDVRPWVHGGANSGLVHNECKKEKFKLFGHCEIF